MDNLLLVFPFLGMFVILMLEIRRLKREIKAKDTENVRLTLMMANLLNMEQERLNGN